MLKGLLVCCVCIDDIMISVETDEIHLENLHRVLQRLQECGPKLNPNKFHFMLHQVVYLGTTITAERVKTIREADAPTNVPELWSFLEVQTSFANFWQILQELRQPYASYFVKKYPVNGENWNKKL